MAQRISQMTSAGALAGDELVELSKLSASITKTATTISAQASDNSFNDSGAGLVAAGFTVGKAVKVTGFTGNVANNIFSGVVTAVTTSKLTIGGTDGDVIVDDAAGESVTITQWETRRTTAADIAALGAAGTGSPLTYTIDTGSTADSDPGAGLLKFNNATQSAATMLYIDNDTAGGTTITTLLASLAQTGFITLVQTDNPDNWRIYKITAVTSASGYYKLTVVNQAGNGSFADDAAVSLTFDSDAASTGAGLSTQNTFTKAQTVAPVRNTSATGTITPDFTASNAFIYTLTGNLTIANGTGPTDGQVVTFKLKQDGTGSRTLTLGNKYKVAGGAPVLTTAAGGLDILSFIYDGTDDVYVGSFGKGAA